MNKELFMKQKLNFCKQTILPLGGIHILKLKMLRKNTALHGWCNGDSPEKFLIRFQSVSNFVSLNNMKQ